MNDADAIQPADEIVTDDVQVEPEQEPSHAETELEQVQPVSEQAVEEHEEVQEEGSEARQGDEQVQEGPTEVVGDGGALEYERVSPEAPSAVADLSATEIGKAVGDSLSDDFESLRKGIESLSKSLALESAGAIEGEEDSEGVTGNEEQASTYEVTLAAEQWEELQRRYEYQNTAMFLVLLLLCAVLGVQLFSMLTKGWRR